MIDAIVGAVIASLFFTGHPIWACVLLGFLLFGFGIIYGTKK